MEEEAELFWLAVDEEVEGGALGLEDAGEVGFFSGFAAEDEEGRVSLAGHSDGGEG